MTNLVKKEIYSCSTPSFKVVLSELFGAGFRCAGYQLDFARTDGSYLSRRDFGPDERSKAALAYLCSVNNVLSSID